MLFPKYDARGALENNWLHPPYALIGAVIRHIIFCDAEATLIAPKWYAAPWWPNLMAILPSTQQVSLGLCSDALVYPQDLPLSPGHLPRGELWAIRFTAKQR